MFDSPSLAGQQVVHSSPFHFAELTPWLMYHFSEKRMPPAGPKIFQPTGP